MRGQVLLRLASKIAASQMSTGTEVIGAYILSDEGQRHSGHCYDAFHPQSGQHLYAFIMPWESFHQSAVIRRASQESSCRPYVCDIREKFVCVL